MMDPLTLTTTFATLVQLIGMFKQESGESAKLDHQQFMDWLSYHRHEELKALLFTNAVLQSEVTGLLRQDNATILAKLDSMNAILAKMLSQVEGFRGISRAMLPHSELSDQAISVLRQLVASGSRNLIYGEEPGGAVLQPEDGEPFTYTDRLFLSDDIDSLVECGFLAFRNESPFAKMLGLTRAGAAFIRSLDGAK